MAITTTPYSRTTWVNDSTPDIDADHLNKIETALVADRESIGGLVDSDTQLAGNFAMVETSPATANHSVGEYIVYNGQLYKVTTAITAGQSLTVGTNISAVSVGSELKSFSEPTSLTGDNYTIYYTRIGNIVFVRGAFTYQGTYDTEISGLPSAPTIVSFIARSNGTGKKIGISLIGNRISFYMQLGDAPVSGNEYHFQFSYMTVG